MNDQTITEEAGATTEQAVIAVNIAEYNATAAALAELRSKYKGVIFPVETAAGMKDALAARKELRDIRVGLEKLRKDIKAPALKRCQEIDSEAKTITEHLVALEDPIDSQIKAEEARKEREKQERERIERERVAGIKAKIEAIRQIPVDMAGEPASTLAGELEELNTFQPGEEFAEFVDEAKAAITTVIQTLTVMHDRQAAQEVEAARLEKERAELERQRADAAERDRQEAERRAEQDRIDREAREAEAARLRADREAFEEERRIFNEQRAAAKAKEQPAPAVTESPVPETTEQNAAFSATYENGAPMYSTTTFKENGEPIMLDPEGKRSIFCDIADDMEPEAPSFVGVDMAAGDDQTVVETVELNDADAIVRELAGYTSMQFQALAKKVKAAGFDGLYDTLVDIAAQISSGKADSAIKAGNWMAMADADKEMALASHACVSIVVGDGEMGESVLRGLAAYPTGSMGEEVAA